VWSRLKHVYKEKAYTRDLVKLSSRRTIQTMFTAAYITRNKSHNGNAETKLHIEWTTEYPQSLNIPRYIVVQIKQEWALDQCSYHIKHGTGTVPDLTISVHLVHVNFTGCVYLITIATEAAHRRETTISWTFHNFPDFSLTNVEFRDFSRFSRRGHPVSTSGMTLPSASQHKTWWYSLHIDIYLGYFSRALRCMYLKTLRATLEYTTKTANNVDNIRSRQHPRRLYTRHKLQHDNKQTAKKVNKRTYKVR